MRRARFAIARARPLVLLALLACAGCDAPRPAFLARLQEDCQAGDDSACGLLSTSAVAPEPRLAAAPAARPRSPVQRNVDAIMRGMERTRATPRVRTTPPEESSGSAPSAPAPVP